MNIIDKFYDLIDECCMLLNEKIKLNYFDALVRVANDIVYDVDESKLEEQDIKTLIDKYNLLTDLTITNEEVRQAIKKNELKVFNKGQTPYPCLINKKSPERHAAGIKKPRSVMLPELKSPGAIMPRGFSKVLSSDCCSIFL
jgi:hypothetical protein